MKDSLDYTSYYKIALWLTGKLEPRIGGCGAVSAPQDTQKEPILCKKGGQ